MEITAKSQLIVNQVKQEVHTMPRKANPQVINGIERWWVALRVQVTILMITLKCYGSLRKAVYTARELAKLKYVIHGKQQLRRCIKLNGKYFFGIYIPAFPSPVFNRYIQTELNHILPHKKPVNHLQVVQLAITNHCPLKCEHCFEWKNLNQSETFTTEKLKVLISKFQEAGCGQFHFTGGEPLVNMERLKELVRSSGKPSDIFVLTSGLNLTAENARHIKEAGTTGVIISLDHFDPAMHNIFRGSDHAFNNAINGIHHARDAGLLVSLSICVTKAFVSRQNLLNYVQLARDCGVAFVQLLEPKPVGHYEGKAVTLTKEQTDILEDFYLEVNYSKEYNKYPVILYHGFHQRRLGCFSGGDRIIYIDSAGYVDACPFCQTKNYHAADIISGSLSVTKLTISGCPAYKKQMI